MPKPQEIPIQDIYPIIQIPKDDDIWEVPVIDQDIPFNPFNKKKKDKDIFDIN
jgi:hypothetical protein